MMGLHSIDKRLVECAKRQEQIISVEGKDEDGEEIFVVVATGIRAKILAKILFEKEILVKEKL